MANVSINLLAPAIFAFLLINPAFGKLGSEGITEDYKEVVRMMNVEKGLTCAEYSKYCNIFFGLPCCAGEIYCVPPLPTGGYCIE
ncbi:unnamed protein product [Amaranthus hypochondriacus]